MTLHLSTRWPNGVAPTRLQRTWRASLAPRGVRGRGVRMDGGLSVPRGGVTGRAVAGGEEAREVRSTFSNADTAPNEANVLLRRVVGATAQQAAAARVAFCMHTCVGMMLPALKLSPSKLGNWDGMSSDA